MVPAVLLWLLGFPAGILILLLLFGVLYAAADSA